MQIIGAFKAQLVLGDKFVIDRTIMDIIGGGDPFLMGGAVRLHSIGAFKAQLV